LIGQVRVGDRLVALDGRDNTMMIATTTSWLIVSKEYNQVRWVMFARPDNTFRDSLAATYLHYSYGRKHNRMRWLTINIDRATGKKMNQLLARP
jgi:hypothetical protein